jgi:osmoprotectant transport system substrate-binding protein
VSLGRQGVRASLALAWALALFGCTSRPAPAGVPGAPQPLVVASFDFPESVLLAKIYGQALAAHGYPVRELTGLGARELVLPSAMSGLVQFVPEYAGSALGFASLGRAIPTADVAETHAALVRALGPTGLVALAPAPAQDQNAIVVTQATASRLGLDRISDLAAAATSLSFGGPPECLERAFCLVGLGKTYGLHFHEFVPLDTGGPLTLQALLSGDVDVALLFTTDPAIAANRLVVLADDRALQPAENVTPVVSARVVDRYGKGLTDVIDAVSARLSTPVLLALNGSVSSEGRDPAAVAAAWLRAQGLG